MNSNQPTLRPIVLALLVLALLAAVLPAAAQSAPTSTPFPPTAPPTIVPSATPLPVTTPLPVPAASFEYVGTVEVLGSRTITLSGLPMDASLAYVKGTPVALGDLVKAEGVITESGQWMATELRVVNPARSDHQPGELELVGVLTAMTQNRLTVGGLPMDAANAEFGSGVGIGQPVKVHATLNADGQWVIREIELASGDDHAGELTLYGTINEMGDDYIVVSGQRINIANAEVEGVLAVGMFVEVHLRYVDGQWVASEVEQEDSDDDLDDADDDQDDDSDDDQDDDADDDHDDDDDDDHDDQDDGDDHGGDHDDDDDDDQDDGDDHGGDHDDDDQDDD